MEQLKECIEAVSKINEDLQEQLYSEKYGMVPWIWAEIQIGSEGHVVMFLGECIYNSANEERVWIEDGPSMRSGDIVTCDLVPAHYEDMEKYLRRKINELIGTLSGIKL